MPYSWKKFIQNFVGSRRRGHEIDPDEVMLDSSNLPNFDTDQFEGRIEKPISLLVLYLIGAVFILVAIVFLSKAFDMQFIHGEEYASRSQRNLLRPVPIFAGRGVIYDRNGVELAWNAPSDRVDSPSSGTAILKDGTIEDTVAHREYSSLNGLAHVLGYVQYPSKDGNGFYYQEDFKGVDGAEQYFDKDLQGKNGSRLIEVDARGSIVSQNIVRPPIQGKNINLSIDSKVQSALYFNIKDIADRVGFAGGAGVIMDIYTGEIIALTSYPEYSPQIMSDKIDKNAVKRTLNDSNLPFLDRAVDGLYVPGSIVKPFMAMGALNENIIDPSTVIVTKGFISIPNPYDSTKSSIFNDWKNHGSINMRQAIAVSSDVYFYTIGGGYKDQKGMGIVNIDKYMSMFGFGSKIPDSFFTSKSGIIPTPEWKKKTFNEDWYVGNTYHTAIGQYGFLVTPVQVVRAIASIANGGTLLVPKIIKGSDSEPEKIIELPMDDFKVVREGMRMSVEIGTSKALNVPYVKIAGKSGTAELGISKSNVNSWITGFWPYEAPRYAFAVLMERGSVHNLIGAAAVMRQQLDWMNVNTPEYFKI